LRTSVQPAWVLGRRAYRDSSLIVELLTAENGRMSAVVKGAHRKQRGGSFSSLMQPFCPILVGLGGKAELKYLSSAENASVAISLPGERLFSGLYMNELLVRLLPKFDAVPQLFATYGTSLLTLSENQDPELTLRRFELALFEELGYEIQWHRDDRGQGVSTDRNYLFAHDRGFVETADDKTAEVLLGADLMALDAWYRRNTPLTNHAKQSLKRIMRQAVDYRLDGRPLKVLEALNQWRNLGQTAGEV
jgi:DNA repair protein RecO (recombination protein O)